MWQVGLVGSVVGGFRNFWENEGKGKRGFWCMFCFRAGVDDPEVVNVVSKRKRLRIFGLGGL